MENLHYLSLVRIPRSFLHLHRIFGNRKSGNKLKNILCVNRFLSSFFLRAPRVFIKPKFKVHLTSLGLDRFNGLCCPLAPKFRGSFPRCTRSSSTHAQLNFLSLYFTPLGFAIMPVARAVSITQIYIFFFLFFFRYIWKFFIQLYTMKLYRFFLNQHILYPLNIPYFKFSIHLLKSQCFLNKICIRKFFALFVNLLDSIKISLHSIDSVEASKV